MEPALTLQKVLELGRLTEPADAQTKDISASKETAENIEKDIQKLRISKPKHYQHQQDNFRKTPKRKESYQNKPNYQRSQSVLECSRCGIKGHHGSECRKSRDKTCCKCGKLGHFEKICIVQKLITKLIIYKSMKIMFKKISVANKRFSVGQSMS